MASLLAERLAKVTLEFLHGATDRRGVNDDQIGSQLETVFLFNFNGCMANLPTQPISDHCISHLPRDRERQSSTRSSVRARSDHGKWPATGPNCASSELTEDCTFVDPVDQADRR